MSNKVIMLDIDGVLADFSEGYRSIERKRGLPETFAVKWDDMSNKEVWNEIKNSATFWMELQPTQEFIKSPALWQVLNDRSYDVYFTSSRVGVDVRRQTQYWLRSFGIRYPGVIISSRKGEVAKAIKATHCLDDKAGNALAVSWMAPGCKSYLLNTPYNQFDHEVIGGKVSRVDSVAEFIQLVDKG
jgi:phosphoglycolate phosphatase-like HAD superfamily hydrolase